MSFLICLDVNINLHEIRFNFRFLFLFLWMRICCSVKFLRPLDDLEFYVNCGRHHIFCMREQKQHRKASKYHHLALKCQSKTVKTLSKFKSKNIDNNILLLKMDASIFQIVLTEHLIYCIWSIFFRCKFRRFASVSVNIDLYAIDRNGRNGFNRFISFRLPHIYCVRRNFSPYHIGATNSLYLNHLNFVNELRHCTFWSQTSFGVNRFIHIWNSTHRNLKQI